ncbi:MAG: hypothetical protein A2Z27_04095 [candidate division Zixibacteria bacterium RBG_16_50_21]|nr:MAG: hypothetical protein A2Z27_04095 [candidate division Zixibacteria bacterium RBG_16_50_21]
MAEIIRLVTAVLLLSPAFCLAGKTLFVDDLKDGKAGEGSEKNPFRNLHFAVDQAEDGDRIVILPGTYEAQPESYVEELCGNCQNHRTEVKASRGFLIKDKAVHLVGSGADSTILVTNAGYGVLFDNSRGAIITGIKITGGKRNPDGNATDAGIVAKFSSVTVSQCEIADNQDSVQGVIVGIGGIFGRENSELIIQDNYIHDNRWDGIALYRGATALITDNVIDKGRGAGIGITWDGVATVYRNRVSNYWKGIGSFGDSRAVVRNNAVFDNLGWGIIASGNSYMEASNNVITRNGNCGFAVWGDGARGLATNNIITDNGWRKEWVCPCVGVWWYEGKKEQFSISYNNVWNNVAGNYKDMEELTGKDGNISVNPQFAGQTDFKVAAESELKDKGNPVYTDPDGSVSDLGIYGGPQTRQPR